jgi:hypothetical protein
VVTGYDYPTGQDYPPQGLFSSLFEATYCAVIFPHMILRLNVKYGLRATKIILI